MKNKYIYCMAIVILAFIASESFAQNVTHSKNIKYPYHASKERTAQITSNYKKIKEGMTPQQVKSLLGEPDETCPLYEPKIWKPKQVGYSQWFIIQRNCENGSVKEKDEILVGIRYDLQWKVAAVDHWGFDKGRNE